MSRSLPRMTIEGQTPWSDANSSRVLQDGSNDTSADPVTSPPPYTDAQRAWTISLSTILAISLLCLWCWTLIVARRRVGGMMAFAILTLATTCFVGQGAVLIAWQVDYTANTTAAQDNRLVSLVVLSLLGPLIADCAFIPRILSFSPASVHTRSTRMAVVAFPMLVKLPRVVIIALSTARASEVIRNLRESEAELASSVVLGLKWWRVEWLLTIVDDLYSTIFLTARLALSARGHTPSPGFVFTTRRVAFASLTTFLLPFVVLIAVTIFIFRFGLPEHATQIFIIGDWIIILGAYFSCVVPSLREEQQECHKDAERTAWSQRQFATLPSLVQPSLEPEGIDSPSVKSEHEAHQMRTFAGTSTMCRQSEGDILDREDLSCRSNVRPSTGIERVYQPMRLSSDQIREGSSVKGFQEEKSDSSYGLSQPKSSEILSSPPMPNTCSLPAATCQSREDHIGDYPLSTSSVDSNSSPPFSPSDRAMPSSPISVSHLRHLCSSSGSGPELSDPWDMETSFHPLSDPAPLSDPTSIPNSNCQPKLSIRPWTANPNLDRLCRPQLTTPFEPEDVFDLGSSLRCEMPFATNFYPCSTGFVEGDEGRLEASQSQSVILQRTRTQSKSYRYVSQCMNRDSTRLAEEARSQDQGRSGVSTTLMSQLEDADADRPSSSRPTTVVSSGGRDPSSPALASPCFTPWPQAKLSYYVAPPSPHKRQLRSSDGRAVQLNPLTLPGKVEIRSSNTVRRFGHGHGDGCGYRHGQSHSHGGSLSWTRSKERDGETSRTQRSLRRSESIWHRASPLTSSFSFSHWDDEAQWGMQHSNAVPGVATVSSTPGAEAQITARITSREQD